MCETTTSKRELIGLSIANSAGSTVLKVDLQTHGIGMYAFTDPELPRL